MIKNPNMIWLGLSIQVCGVSALAGDIVNGQWNGDPYDGWIQQEIRDAGVPSGDIMKLHESSSSAYEVMILGRGPQGYPKDVFRICPRFADMSEDSRLTFWSDFFHAVAFAESGYDYRQVFHEPASLGVDSVGLLQLSTSDNGAEGCSFQSSSSLAPQDPKQNLLCGVHIMTAQLALCGTLFQGFPESSDCLRRTTNHQSSGSFYWSTLNSGANHGDGFAQVARKWRDITGWDIRLGKMVGGLFAALPECYSDSQETGL